MERLYSSVAIMALSLGLTGCGMVRKPAATARPLPAATDTGIRPRPRPDESGAIPPGLRTAPANATSAAQLDTTTPAELAAARNKAATGTGGQSLGRTIASLGDPARGGFWLQTPLVDTLTPGRIAYPASGKKIAVDLIPIDGPRTGGSRISLAAMRALDAPLTGLPEIVVYAK